MPGVTPINERSTGDHGYVAGFMNERVGIYARSLAAAKQKAVEHFKPKKRNAGLLWTELAEISTDEITFVQDEGNA